MPNFPAVKLSYSLIKIPLFRTNIISYGNKIEQRRALNSVVQCKFQLTFFSLSAADANLIRDFFIARKGRLESFTWNNPEDNVNYNVRFEDDVINIEHFTHLLYNIGQVNLIEVAA